MAFDNRTIKSPNPEKPHIVKIDGYWRVSEKPGNAYFVYCEYDRLWNKAHGYANDLNCGNPIIKR